MCQLFIVHQNFQQNKSKSNKTNKKNKLKKTNQKTHEGPWLGFSPNFGHRFTMIDWLVVWGLSGSMIKRTCMIEAQGYHDHLCCSYCCCFYQQGRIMAGEKMKQGIGPLCSMSRPVSLDQRRCRLNPGQSLAHFRASFSRARLLASCLIAIFLAIARAL